VTRSFFLKGRARVTIFAAEGNARTFDYSAGDVGVVPRNMGHFIENLSDDEPLEVLEIFRAGTDSSPNSPYPLDTQVY
jgi:oxalate decarboxylase/phosphoglucose isomerase-like protein (cupin superfamily)